MPPAFWRQARIPILDRPSHFNGASSFPQVRVLRRMDTILLRRLQISLKSAEKPLKSIEIQSNTHENPMNTNENL